MGTILIQIVFYQMLFLALYEVLLKRDTHYNLQRFYLLLLPMVALFLPFIVVPSLSETVLETSGISLPAVILGEAITTSETVTTTTEAISSTSYSVLLILWVVGSFISGIWSIWKYRKLHNLRASASIIKKEDYNLAILPNTDVAFSFRNTIYLGEELNEEAKKVILKHEKVHVKQKHSIDLVWYQLLRIVFWWNPFVYLFQNRLQAVHEYIADAEVVQSITKKEYYQSLLSQVFKTNNISFTNTFYKQSLIKNRIIMLQKIKSPRRFKLKYLLVLPLLAFMLFVVSCVNDEADTPALIEEESSMKTPSRIPVGEALLDSLQKQSLDNVPFAVIEKVPVYPGCEGNNEELRNCMSQKINELVANQFNANLGTELGLEGVQRIVAVFTIDTSGNLADVKIRAPHVELENETRRVLDLLPQFTPGEQKGNKVGVTFTLPIVFEVEA